MKLHIIIAFLCLNMALGMQNFPGSPIYAGTADNCYYRNSTTPPNDPIQGKIPGGLGITNATDLENELLYPKNATLVNGSIIIGSIQDGFDSLRESTDQFLKSIEAFKHLIKSNYALDVLGNFAINCQLAPNGTLIQVDGDPSKPGINPHPLWVYFLNGVSTLMVILTILMLFYVITGRGFSLTS